MKKVLRVKQWLEAQKNNRQFIPLELFNGKEHTTIIERLKDGKKFTQRSVKPTYRFLAWVGSSH